MRSRYALGRAIAGGLFFAEAVHAEDILSSATPNAQQVETASGWTFAIAPYLWASGLSGDVASFGLPTVALNADFGDILSNLDLAAMAMAEARYDRFSVFGDVMYTKISSGKATPKGILATGAGRYHQDVCRTGWCRLCTSRQPAGST